MNERVRLGKTQEDLHKYKQRIDANVEQQKEYSEIMATMQNKVALKSYDKIFNVKLLASRLQETYKRIRTEN